MEFLKWILLKAFFTTSVTCLMSAMNSEDTLMVMKLLMSNYQKEIAPIKDGRPINVTINMYISDMVPLKKINMHFSLDCYLSMSWRDYRLIYNGSLNSFALFDSSIADKIWTPNLYFSNCKSGFIHNLTKKNMMIKIASDGTIYMSQRISITAFCAMKLKFFPFDIQHCQLHISDYSYPTPFIRLRWMEPSVQTVKNLHSAEFSKVEHSEYHEEISNRGINMTFDWLKVNLTLYRDLRIYVFRDFLPCILIVAMSWITFWIDYKSAPSRVCLGITTVLTIVSKTNNIHKISPAPRNLRSLDIYLLICLIFVFGALFEYSIVGMTDPRKKKTWKKDHKRKQELEKARISEDSEKENCEDVNQGFFHLHSKDDGIVLDIPRQRFCSQSSVNVNFTERNCKSYKFKTYELQDKSEKISKKKEERKKMPVRFFGPFVFRHIETHIIDQYSKVLFPFAFAVTNAIFFIFHYLHPETVDG